jgi:predicted nucleic acid-binding protein
MTVLLDTSYLLALTNTNDRNHQRVLNIARTLNDALMLPTSVLPEICYLVASRMGHTTMRQFLTSILESDTILEPVTPVDLRRATELLHTYADSKLDYVDATLVAIAERHTITQILTLDRRDFSIIRPRHCNYFELLP